MLASDYAESGNLSAVSRQEIPFYAIADLDATIKMGYEAFKERHHARLVKDAKKALEQAPTPEDGRALRLAHTKGRLKSSEGIVFKILLSLAFKEMERLREHNPSHYEFLLSNHMDAIYVSTNRQQILTMTKGEIRSLSTVSNALNRLRDAGIIVRTKHTSRTTHEVQDGNGRKTKLVVLRKEGRGNFQLYFTKEIIEWKYELTTKFREKRQNVDNQYFFNPKNEILEQSHDILIETLKKDNNNSGNCGEGVRLRADNILIESPPIGDENKYGNETRLTPPPLERNTGGATTQTRHIEAEDAAAALAKWQEDGGRRGEKYRQRHAADTALEAKLPSKEADRFAAQLWLMAKAMIFANFSEKFLQQITVYAIHSLKIHLFRLDLPFLDAFEVLTYAMQRQSEQLAKGGRVYAPMTWLNPDLEYTGGTLRFVVDNWLIKGEFKRLQKQNMKYDKQIRWNYAYAFSRNIFKQLVIDLEKSGFSLVLNRLNSGYYDRHLETYFSKNGIGEKARATIRKKFADRASALMAGLKQLPEETPDATMKAFNSWRKSKNIAK